MKKVNYVRAPLSAAFPTMSDAELQLLAEDIKANGQREPIVVKGKEILDGWHRYQACQRAGVDPWIVEYDHREDGESVEAFVMSRNFHRRQMTAEERAAAAIKVLGYVPGARGVNKKGATAADVAKAAGVGVATVKRVVQKSKVSSDPLGTDGPKLSKDKQRIEELERELLRAKKEIARLKQELSRLKR